MIAKKPTKKLPEGFHYQYRNFEGENEWEVMCPHGVGHRKGVHGCDGCCKNVFMPKHKNTLTLKWGTLKAWDFTGDEEARKLLDRYMKIGSSASVIMQKDTPEQKEIICKLIDKVHGKICLDWEGKYVTKSQAKKYVLNYGQH